MGKPKLRNIVLDIYLMDNLDTSEMTIADIVALGLDEQDSSVYVDTIGDDTDLNVNEIPLDVVEYFGLDYEDGEP